MKILFIEPCFINFGGYYRALNICKGLARNGLKVDLLVTSNQKFFLKIKKTTPEPNLTIYEMPRFTVNFYINGRIIRGIISLFIALFGKYDIIHAAMPMQFESNIPAILLKPFGKKIVMDWDEIFEDTFPPIFPIKQYIQFCEHILPRFFPNYCVTSDVLKKIVKKRGAQNVVKIINGVDFSEFNPKNKITHRQKLGLETKTKYLFAYGNTFAANRPYRFLKTFEYIVKLDPSIKLLCNFNPDEIYQRDHLQGRIDPKIFANIINLGYISNKEYLYTADAALFLSGDGIREQANYPIRIGSYIGSNLVIAINDGHSEASDSLKRFNCAIMSQNLKKLASSTVEFLNNPQVQKKYHRRLTQAKKYFSVEYLTLDLIKFYQSL